MDTKLKNSRPLGVWLTFFVATSIIISLLFISLTVLGNYGGNFKALKSPFVDYKDSYAFKQRTSYYFNELFSLVQYNADEEANYTSERTFTSLGGEGENIRYWAINKNSDFMTTNIAGTSLENIADGSLPNLPKDYSYIWYFDGQNLSIMQNGEKVDYNRLDSGYRGLVPKYQYYHSAEELENTAVFVAVKDPLVENLYESSAYFTEQKLLPLVGTIAVILILISISLLIFAFIKRQAKKDFDRSLASWSGKLWLEAKVIITLFPFLFLGIGIMSAVTYQSYNYVTYPQLIDVLSNAFVATLFFLFAFWWFYLLLMDLIYNRKKFFSHNSINSIFKWYQKYEKRYPWQKLMLRRAYLLVAAEVILAPLSLMFLTHNVFMAVLIAIFGLYLIYRYLKHYDLALSDFAALLDHIELMKNGDMDTKLQLPKGSALYQSNQNLNTLQEGINMAISEQIKAERMKIDLITNVSHDLKTPLTSIISYVDLLNKEGDLPEHVNDYIQILGQKSQRLKNLIEDLFDLAKASSENISLDMKQIDLARLIQQTLADMEENINESGLVFRVNIPDQPVNIVSDGDKLYRVWENLITNALKYSLHGSRVFIDLKNEEKKVIATIKNTANYEINFNEDEILERFTRGDKARTTEGSGLGLSIAQSFTQACGGKFTITVDGDLFKVELEF